MLLQKRQPQGDRAWNNQVDPHRRTAEAAGHLLHYIDLGSSAPLVMVHGFADSTYCWHKNVNALLEAGRRLIIIDQPGMGRSPAPPKPYVFSVENQAAAVMALADRLELERFSLLGHSMGGGITLYLCLTHPQRIAKAAVIAPVCFLPPRRAYGMMNLIRLPLVKYIAATGMGKAAVKAAMQSACRSHEHITAELISEYFRPLKNPGYLDTLVSLRNDFFSEEFQRMSESHRRFSVSLLIIWGGQDTWVPSEFGPRLQQLVPLSKLEVIKECGHLPHQERSDRVNRLLRDFFLGK